MIELLTGAATVPQYLIQFFWSIRLPIFDCYGSTEAILHTTNHQNFSYKMGSVGKPLHYAQIKIGPGNEIWVKSPSVMNGYYLKEEYTQEVLTSDGWYKSGDIGYIDEDGFLFLTGRANAIFKLLNGKYVNPEDIEQQLRLSNQYNAVLITQDTDMFLTAVVSVEGDPNDIQTISAIIRDINDLYNNRKVETERIKRLIVVKGTWSVQTGEYTPTMKLKRKFLQQKYKDVLGNSIPL
jgi:long-chain acyl-CoA synthetase